MIRVRGFAGASIAFALQVPGLSAAGEHWPGFRGPNASGVAEDSRPPIAWDVAAGDHVLWKTPIPGLSHASPIIWGDKIFIATAIAEGMDAPLKVGLYGAGDPAADMVPHEWKVYCLDKKSGAILWERLATRGVPKVQRHTKATHANSTPATDGRVVVAFFGSEGLFAYDYHGELLWSHDLGVLDVGPWNAPELQWGFASSPLIHDGMVYVQCDVKQDPRLLAFDAQTGAEKWRVARDDVQTWCTPSIFEGSQGKQLVVNGCKHIGGYDLATGKEIWRMHGGGGIPVPAPVVADELVYFTSNHRPINDEDRGQPIFAVRADAARGDISLPLMVDRSDAVAWAQFGLGTYMQTPLVYQGLAYFCRDNGVAWCGDARTGEERWRQRIGDGGHTASPVAANGHIYWASEEGDVTIVKASPKFEKVGSNSLGEICMATPAISGDVIYFRTQKHVIAIGAK